MFEFPEDDKRRKVWTPRVKVNDFITSKSSRLCAKHFNKIEIHFFFAYSFCGSLGLTTNLSLSTFFRIDSFVGKFIKVIGYECLNLLKITNAARYGQQG
jgi:hypothetical protein